jgi:hypothetical protein
MQNLEILHQVPVAESAGTQEHVFTDEQGLIAEKDVQRPRAKVHPRGDHTSNRAAFIEGESERAANDVRVA